MRQEMQIGIKEGRSGLMALRPNSHNHNPHPDNGSAVHNHGLASTHQSPEQWYRSWARVLDEY